MDQNDSSDDNPLKETADDRIERELRDIFHVLMTIDKRLSEIADSIEANTANIEILEEAIANFVDIPTRPIKIRYDHRENKLWINEKIPIKFESKEADVFGLMFTKSNGKPKKSKFYYSEVAELLRSNADSIDTPTNKAIFLRVKRIKEKLDKRLNTKNLLVVKTKEFYFSSK